MNRLRATALAVSMGTALAAFPGGVLVPVAHADPLQPIINDVNSFRTRSGCDPLRYKPVLEVAAQRSARGGRDETPEYDGQAVFYAGQGDPQQRAIDEASRSAASGINRCDVEDFGVGFVRDDDTEVDTVIIVLGIPAAPPPPPPPVEEEPDDPPVAEKPTDPGPGAETEPDDPAEEDPDDPETEADPADPEAEPDDPAADEADGPLAAPSVSTAASGLGVAVTITDHSGVDSECTYTAPLVVRDFSLPADGDATINIAPLARLGIPYSVQIECDNGTSLDTTIVW